MYRILIVEDDETIAGLLKKHLESWGYEVFLAEDFAYVLGAFLKAEPQLVILDLKLPSFNGYHWCDEIRKISKVPILFLSSAADNMNMVMALSRGADDFMAKPFDLDVLVAKVQALLRRSYSFGRSADLLDCRGAVLNLGSGTLTYEGETLELTKNEKKDPGAPLRAGGKGGHQRYHYGKTLGERQLCGRQHIDGKYDPSPEKTGGDRPEGFHCYQKRSWLYGMRTEIWIPGFRMPEKSGVYYC